MEGRQCQAWSNSKTVSVQGVLTWLATSPDCRKTDPHKPQCTGCQKTQNKDGEALSKNIWKRWALAGMKPTGAPVTVSDGDFSSPDGSRGTGGPKYAKYKFNVLALCQFTGCQDLVVKIHFRCIVA